MPPTTGQPDIAEMTFREASAQAEDILAAEATARHDHRNTIPEIEAVSYTHLTLPTICSV